jgi:hypothetical protein
LHFALSSTAPGFLGSNPGHDLEQPFPIFPLQGIREDDLQEWRANVGRFFSALNLYVHHLHLHTDLDLIKSTFGHREFSSERRASSSTQGSNIM